MKKIQATAIALLTSIACFSQSNQGWTNLFDGKTLNGWKKLAGDAVYSVEDGMLTGTAVAASPNTFLVTEKEFGDFILELEVKVEDTIVNSGVQLRSHFDAAANNGKGKVYGYQYEIDPSSRRWSAGIYDEGRRDWLYPMMLHAEAQDLFKLHEFNKIKVECFGHTIRTWINGQPAAYLVDTLDAKGFIGLQVHAISKPGNAGQKIFWKNIRIREINKPSPDFSNAVYVFSTVPNTLTAYEKKCGWKLLFDGKSSAGWRSAYGDHFPAKGWTIKDGILKVESSEGKEPVVGGDIITTEKFTAFDLSFEFKLTTGANSGVKYFVTADKSKFGSALGFEYQLLDDQVNPDAKLGRGGDRTLASLYDLIAAQKQQRFLRPIGEWNTGRIIVYPNHYVEHFLNGIRVLDFERGSAALRDLVAISKYRIYDHFADGANTPVLLQDHGGEVSFRSIKIRPLK